LGMRVGEESGAPPKFQWEGRQKAPGGGPPDYKGKLAPYDKKAKEGPDEKRRRARTIVASENGRRGQEGEGIPEGQCEDRSESTVTKDQIFRVGRTVRMHNQETKSSRGAWL